MSRDSGVTWSGVCAQSSAPQHSPPLPPPPAPYYSAQDQSLSSFQQAPAQPVCCGWTHASLRITLLWAILPWPRLSSCLALDNCMSICWIVQQPQYGGASSYGSHPPPPPQQQYGYGGAPVRFA